MGTSTCRASSLATRSRSTARLRNRGANGSATPIFCEPWTRNTPSTILWCTRRGCWNNGSGSGSRRPRRSAELLVRALLEQFQLGANCFRGQGKILPVAHHLRLTFAAQNVAQELLHLGIDGLLRIAIDVEEDVRVHRVLALAHVFQRELVRRISGLD